MQLNSLCVLDIFNANISMKGLLKCSTLFLNKKETMYLDCKCCLVDTSDLKRPHTIFEFAVEQKKKN